MNAIQRLLEYNPYHDPKTGRFTSKGAAAGGNAVVSLTARGRQYAQRDVDARMFKPEQIDVAPAWKPATTIEEARQRIRDQFGVRAIPTSAPAGQTISSWRAKTLSAMNTVGEELSHIPSDLIQQTRDLHPGELSIVFGGSSQTNGNLGTYQRQTNSLALNLVGIRVLSGTSDNPPAPGPFSIGGKSLRNAFRHEFGHAVLDVIERPTSPLREKWFAVSNREFRSAKKTVSHYAATNMSEFFAESFAVYGSRGYKKGRLPDRLESFFDELFRRSVQESARLRESEIDDLLERLFAAIEASFTAGVADMIKDFTFELPFPSAVEYMREVRERLITGIDDVTWEETKKIISDGMERGDSYGTTAKRLGELFSGYTKKRAELIAVQESGEGYEAGSKKVIDGMMQAGLAMEKSWLTVGDDRVSEICRGNADAGWIAADKPFPSGHDRPLGHVRCRCTALYRMADVQETDNAT